MIFDLGWIRWDRSKVVVCVLTSPKVSERSTFLASVSWSPREGVTFAEVPDGGLVGEAIVEWLMYSSAAHDRILDAYLRDRCYPRE